MSPSDQLHQPQQEGRIKFAIEALQQRQFRSVRRAADAFRVTSSTLQRRYNGTLAQANCHKLARTEEQTIIQYILDLDLRGFAPRLCEVEDMADKLLGVRGGEPVGKHWAERFMMRSDKLDMAFSRAKASRFRVSLASRVVAPHLR
jgi:hypothetical protein